MKKDLKNFNKEGFGAEFTVPLITVKEKKIEKADLEKRILVAEYWYSHEKHFQTHLTVKDGRPNCDRGN
jgi:hypothetical protein